MKHQPKEPKSPPFDAQAPVPVTTPEESLWLAAIVESSDDAIISKTLDGIITSWNVSAERIFGYTAEEVVGRPVLILLPPDRLSEETAILERIRGGERVDHYETIRRRKDGSLVNVSLTVSPIKDKSGRIMGASKIARDISERKAAEQRIGRLNETLSSMLASLPDILYIVDHRKIRFQNPLAAQFSATLRKGDELIADIQKHVDEVIQTGEDYLPRDFKDLYRFKFENEERKFLLRVVAMGEKSGNIFGAVVMLQDVTQFSLLDEVKTNLLATVSHEIKTPVTSLRLALMLLLEKAAGELKPEQEELLKMAHGDCERLLTTLHRLLDLTRYEEKVPEMVFETVAPSILIQAAVDEVLPATVRKRIVLKVELEKDLPNLKIDRGRMTHVIANLLTNAIKYSPEGAKVVVSARKNPPRQIRLSVVDSGPGIAEEYHDKIFERFFRLPHNIKPGAGLGLFIVRLFTQAHGGTVGIRSEPGCGSEFFITLPAEPTSAQQTQDALPQGNMSAKGEVESASSRTGGISARISRKNLKRDKNSARGES